MNCILVLKPTSEATAPSKDPWGKPIKKISKNEIIFKLLSSIINYLNIALTKGIMGILLIIFILVKKIPSNWSFELYSYFISSPK